MVLYSCAFLSTVISHSIAKINTNPIASYKVKAVFSTVAEMP